MPIPIYDKCMLPLLEFASDNREHHIREAIEYLANHIFNLSDFDKSEKLSSGKKFKFDDRVQWANTYLKKAGLLQSTGRGTFQITQRGFEVLAINLEFLDVDFLTQFPEFAEFRTKSPSNFQAVQLNDEIEK